MSNFRKLLLEPAAVHNYLHVYSVYTQILHLNIISQGSINFMIGLLGASIETSVHVKVACSSVVSRLKNLESKLIEFFVFVNF